MEEPYDGVEKIWWAKREDMVYTQKPNSGHTAWQAILEDEKKFYTISYL